MRLLLLMMSCNLEMRRHACQEMLGNLKEHLSCCADVINATAMTLMLLAPTSALLRRNVICHPGQHYIVQALSETILDWSFVQDAYEIC